MLLNTLQDLARAMVELHLQCFVCTAALEALSAIRTEEQLVCSHLEGLLGFGRGLSMVDLHQGVLHVKPHVLSPGQGLLGNEPNSGGTGRMVMAKRGWSCALLSHAPDEI